MRYFYKISAKLRQLTFFITSANWLKQHQQTWNTAWAWNLRCKHFENYNKNFFCLFVLQVWISIEINKDSGSLLILSNRFSNQFYTHVLIFTDNSNFASTKPFFFNMVSRCIVREHNYNEIALELRLKDFFLSRKNFFELINISGDYF